jgi:hypothetical protein
VRLADDLPGTPRATSTCCGMTFTFFFTLGADVPNDFSNALSLRSSHYAQRQFHDNTEELAPGFVSCNNLLYSVK